MRYLLVADVVFSLKFGGFPSIDWSLFTDTELKTSESDISLMTQRTEKIIKYSIAMQFSFSLQ